MEGSSDIISSGTSSDSLYETSGSSTSLTQSDHETGTLTSTDAGSLNETNSSDANAGSMTTTATLVDSSNTTSGGPATQTQTESETLGSDATVAVGSANTSLWSNGWESYSLYETGNETYSSGSTQAQGTGPGYNLTNEVSGSGVSTLTTTATSTFSSTLTDATTLGANATITGGGSTDSLYETGNDSSNGNGSGTNVRQFAYGDDATGSSTYTTTYSSLNASADTFTQTLSDVQSVGTNGLIASGQDYSTLNTFGTSTATYSENGNRTVTWGADGFNVESYSDTETSSESYSLSDYTSLGVGSNGTIAGGTVTSLTTQSYTDSQSSYESGATNDTDPEGGPTFGGAITMSSITTSEGYSVNQGSESLGALGAVTGGGNSFTFIQNDSNSMTETAILTYGVIGQSNNASFSEIMLGTETYAPGGAVSGGADSFTWIQSAYDDGSISEAGGYGTLGAALDYEIYVNDIVDDGMSDVGTDILGASDSILGGCDTYSYYQDRDLNSTIIDLGTSSTPYQIDAIGWDDFALGDTGSSTLTTDGHIYATDTFGYFEWSSDADYDTASQAFSGGATSETGSASDYYSDNDYGTITNSDGVTTSIDYFELVDSHYIRGAEGGWTTAATGSISWSDEGFDITSLSAVGVESTTADSYSFVDTDSSSDNYLFKETVYGDYNCTVNQYVDNTMYMSGSSSDGPSGGAFSYFLSDGGSENYNESGATTETLAGPETVTHSFSIGRDEQSVTANMGSTARLTPR